MNLLLIHCTKASNPGFRHTVYKCGKLNYKHTKEVIFDQCFPEVIGLEWVEEFRKDPIKMMEKYNED